MLFDALSHPGASADPHAFLSEAAAAGVGHVVIGGYTPETWARDAALTHPAVALYRTAGLHPWAAHEDTDARLARLDEILSAGGVAAVGELGLDRARSRETYAQQQGAFAAQLLRARTHGLPVLLHIVKAHGRAIALLDATPPPGGIVHGFSGAPEVAAAYVRRGLHVSFGAMLLNPRAKKARRAAQQVPLERLLIESDAPDQLDNPAALHEVLDALTALRIEPRAVLAQATLANGLRVYRR